MRDGAAWSSCDDVLLGMGLLKWGQNHGAIAADLLPGYTPSQVAQRVLERTHRNRAANPVKVVTRAALGCQSSCLAAALSIAQQCVHVSWFIQYGAVVCSLTHMIMLAAAGCS
jgi:hypothetical protein